VVADEVQRLAERATAATKQIETLVKTIQADTQEAITSMERSTTNVVAGAEVRRRSRPGAGEDRDLVDAALAADSPDLRRRRSPVSLGDADCGGHAVDPGRRLADFGVRFRNRAGGRRDEYAVATAARVRGRLQAARGRAAGCVAGARSARRAAAGLLPQAAAATILSGLASAPRTPPLHQQARILILSLTRERIP